MSWRSLYGMPRQTSQPDRWTSGRKALCWKVTGGLVVLIGSRRYYQLTGLISEDYDPALNRYTGIFEGLRIQDSRDDPDDADVGFDVIVNIRLQ
jgi:hypothetical protein